MQRPAGPHGEPADPAAGRTALPRDIIHAMPVPTLVIDRTGNLLEVSDSWRWLVYDTEVERLAPLLPGCDLLASVEQWATEAPGLGVLAAHLQAALAGGRPAPVELAIPFPAGRRWFIVASQAVDAGGARVVITLTDITDRRAAEELLEHQARHDVLTGLPNRAMLAERLAQLPAGDAEQKRSVYFLDLDDFKQVNDSFGHEAGDGVLVEVARRLKTSIRDQDFVARLGGDEFVVVAEGLVGDQESAAYADRLADCVSADLTVLGHVVRPSASIGVATTESRSPGAPDRADDAAASLIRMADIAMLQAKASGRGQVGFARSPDATHDSTRRRRSDQAFALVEALRAGDLHAEFQPVVRLVDSVIVAAEALARWTLPSGRVVPPSEFVPLAEQSGLIVPIDHAMLLEAALALVGGALGDTTMRCSVNSSPTELSNGLLLDDVHSVLAATGIAPERLTIEITETGILTDPSAALEQLRQVRQIGVRISLDDFGTGYSSLTHLAVFPIDVLKVDRSFVARMLTDVRALEVIRAVVRLGSALDIDVVAEGIETREQRDALRELGCPLGQGWFYGAAVPAGDFAALAASVPTAD